jgi:hypothetical protein
MTIGGRLQGRQGRIWLTMGAVLLAGAAAALAPPPPAILEADAAARRNFAALASAGIVACAILPFLVWRGAARPKIWIALAVLALALGVASFSVGGYVQRACTARYADKPVIIGADFTTLGSTYRQANPELSSDELLFDAAGVPERIWTRASISRCRTFISATYFLWIPFLVVVLLAAAASVPTTIMSPLR